MLCVASAPVNIDSEFRFVVKKGKVVTGSLYRMKRHTMSVPLEEVDCTEEAAAFAEKVLSDSPMSLPPVHVIDIAMDGDRPSVLEVGCFCCAGLYCCDRHKVALAVSEAAEEEYLKRT